MPWSFHDSVKLRDRWTVRPGDHSFLVQSLAHPPTRPSSDRRIDPRIARLTAVGWHSEPRWFIHASRCASNFKGSAFNIGEGFEVVEVGLDGQQRPSDKKTSPIRLESNVFWLAFDGWRQQRTRRKAHSYERIKTTRATSKRNKYRRTNVKNYWFGGKLLRVNVLLSLHVSVDWKVVSKCSRVKLAIDRLRRIEVNKPIDCSLHILLKWNLSYLR